MGAESFSMFLDINGDGSLVDIIPRPQGNGDMRYEIWKEARHLFTVHPAHDKSELTRWLLDEKYYGINEKTVDEIGLAIENHFM